MANTSGSVQASAERPGRVGAQVHITPGMKLEWPGGSVDLSFFIGSRRMGRSFAYEAPHGAGLFQAPVGFYANRGAWDWAPGYERDAKPDLNRPITADCLFCHTNLAALQPNSVNRYRAVMFGIQCDRCHGPADDHGKLVNPAKLAPRLRDSVCDQCHLSGTVRLVRAGRQLADFRAGQDLGDSLEVLVGEQQQQGGVKVNGHSEALAMSRCKQRSGGKLWCGTCHSPHRAATAASYAETCRGCHASAHRQTEDCVACHMPKGKAYDGGHTVFTNHSLTLKPRSSPLASYFGREPSARDLGLAYVQLGRDRRDSAYFEKAWPLLREAAAGRGRDPVLYATIGSLLQADGRKEQAVGYYRLSLAQDPLQPDVLNKLAGLVGAAEGRVLRERAISILPQPFP